MSTEHWEWLARGPKGNQGNRGNPGRQGEQGKQGERGEPLNPAARRALVYLFVLSMLIGMANLFWTLHVVQAGNQARCVTVEQLARIPGPAEHVYQARAAQLGCTGGKP